MTRDRLFGSDVPFMKWCRANKLLPSFSEECGWVQTDVDTFVHRYLVCVDRIGTREVQPMMEVEVKTRGGSLTDSQLDTYRKKHATIIPSLKWHGQTIRNHGVTILRLSGTSPEDSESIKWCRFDRNHRSKLIESDITLEQLISLLRFDLHPDSLEPSPYRRRHKTSEIVEVVTTPLKFEIEKTIVSRS